MTATRGVSVIGYLSAANGLGGVASLLGRSLGGGDTLHTAVDAGWSAAYA